ncbi:MAG TPA: glycoside hydrolase family 172 protein [Mycobacteriales bacterium]|nr:glycoside hydrolase family 172 protein [Mycobacteriales bacterium]
MEIYELKHLRSRSASAENPSAEPGNGGRSGGGRKAAPCLWPVRSGDTVTLLDHAGPGVIRHIWCTIPPGNPDHLRNVILRIYWDGQDSPSVEAPLGDFFGGPHGRQAPMQSDLVAMQSGKGFNCWIPMPFREHAVITLENDSPADIAMLFYQIDFTLDDDLDDATGYFHAQFRRSNPCPLHEDFTILDGVEGRGRYLGTVIGVRSTFRETWWGEGELKFFLDKDTEFPTICGTGTEDYMGSAWGLDQVLTPFQGAPLVDAESGHYSLYRFHVPDRSISRNGCGSRSSKWDSACGRPYSNITATMRPCIRPPDRTTRKPAISTGATTIPAWRTGTRPCPRRNSRRCRTGPPAQPTWPDSACTTRDGLGRPRIPAIQVLTSTSAGRSIPV